ncbi:MAG: hypothetical protein KAI79_18795, partial [Bacteroidales bacterium]|nr:hypothetical protein [Bacteroidales bacterium]
PSLPPNPNTDYIVNIALKFYIGILLGVQNQTKLLIFYTLLPYWCYKKSLNLSSVLSRKVSKLLGISLLRWILSSLSPFNCPFNPYFKALGEA